MTIGLLKLSPLGGTTQQVIVVKVTPKRVRIRARCLTRIYWRKTDLVAGQELLVSKDRMLDPSLVGEPFQDINRLTGRPC